jgi:hypothetical protein
VALAAAGLLAGCSIPGTVQAHAFSTGFKAGQTLRYQLHTVVAGSLSLAAQQVPLNSEQTITEKLDVKSVDGGGNATVEVSVVDLIDQATGAASSVTAAPVTLVVGPDGRIKSGAAAQLGGRIPSIPGSDQLTPVLAGRPVKQGDSWDVKYSRPNPYGSGGFDFTSHNRYLRDEPVGDRQAAVLESRVAGPIDFSIDFSKLPTPAAGPPPSSPSSPVHYTGSISSTATFWVDLASHEVLKSSSSGTYDLAYSLAQSAGAAGPQQVTFNGTIKTDLTKL